MDEIFTTSHEIPTQPLTPTSTDGEPEVIDLTQSDIQDDVSSEVSEEIIETREEVVEENQPKPQSDDGAVAGDVENGTVVHDENGNNSECTTPDDEEKMCPRKRIRKGKEEKGHQGKLWKYLI